MRAFTLFLLLSAFIYIGCDSNIYEKTIADDDGDAAQAEQLELYLDDKNYTKIISILEGGDYNSYTDREKYLLQLAYLGSTGFDLLSNLEEFLGDDNDKELTDVFIKSIAGANSFANSGVISAKRAVYKNIVKIDADYNQSRDNDISFAAGLTATIDTVMLIGSFADDLLNNTSLGVNFDQVSFNADDPNYIGKVFGEIAGSPTDVAALKGMIDAKLGDIIDNTGALEKVITQLGGSGAASDLKDLEEFLDEMRDPTCIKTEYDSCLTKDSIYNFIDLKIKK
ncbi:MAG: hypothetical protein LBP51_02180 [Deferribacteraceae bacterium]|jgi:hypothetical protein|nr:hypothetical protein [Deferribacteraceae bacterium]